MTDLPPGWEWATLEDLAAAEPRAITDGPFGSNLKTSHYVDEGPRVIRLQNIGFGEFLDERAHISHEHFETLRAHEVAAGDLVVASLGEDLPRACLMPDNLGPAVVKADCIRVRLDRQVSSSFVNYALQRPAIRAAVRDQIHGVGRPRLGMAGVRSLSIPVAPRAEQDRVVAAIEEHVSRLDAAVRALQAARSRMVVMDRAALALLDGSSASGDLVELGDLSPAGRRAAYGVLQPGPHVAEGVPLVRVGDITGNAIAGDLKRIAPKIAEQYPRTRLRGGEVLITRVGTIGRTAVVPAQLQHANVARAVCVLPIREGVSAEYISLALSAPRMRRLLESRAHEVARKTLNLEDVRRFAVRLPSRGEQDALVAAVNSCRALRRSVELSVDVSLRRAASLRRSLLASAFSGRLAAQDPSDEPASVLLERLRTEHAAPVRVKRHRKVKTR